MRRSTRRHGWRATRAQWPGVSRCRYRILASACGALVIEGDTTETGGEAMKDKARWSSEPGDLAELVDAATDADRPTENQYL